MSPLSCNNLLLHIDLFRHTVTSDQSVTCTFKYGFLIWTATHEEETLKSLFIFSRKVLHHFLLLISVYFVKPKEKPSYHSQGWYVQISVTNVLTVSFTRHSKPNHFQKANILSSFTSISNVGCHSHKYLAQGLNEECAECICEFDFCREKMAEKEEETERDGRGRGSVVIRLANPNSHIPWSPAWAPPLRPRALPSCCKKQQMVQWPCKVTQTHTHTRACRDTNTHDRHSSLSTDAGIKLQTSTYFNSRTQMCFCKFFCLLYLFILCCIFIKVSWMLFRGVII